MNLKLTKAEVKALFETAGQMQDDYEGWCFDMSDKKTVKARRQEAERKNAIYESAMEKLKQKLTIPK